MADKWLELVNNQHVRDSGEMKFRGDRRNVWPFVEFESQTLGLDGVITRYSDSEVPFPPLLSQGAASVVHFCIGFAS